MKSWSHLFGIVFEKMSNAAIVYMDQNNVFWNYRTMKSQSDFKFDMHILFRLYGNPLENYKRFEDYTDEDRRAVGKIEKIRAYNYSYFNKLTVLLSREDQHKLRTRENDEFKHSNGSFIEWNKVNKTVKICLYKKMGNAYKSIEITSPNVIALVFNSGWFEYKVAQMLALWDRAKEICMNCRFRFKSNYADKNEVDIIVNAGTKILFVECKVQIAHVTDIDKFRNVIKIYGGMGSKGLFITHAAMPDIARQKCEENGIIPFSLVDYSCPEKVLTMILNSELFNMNVR